MVFFLESEQMLTTAVRKSPYNLIKVFYHTEIDSIRTSINFFVIMLLEFICDLKRVDVIKISVKAWS